MALGPGESGRVAHSPGALGQAAHGQGSGVGTGWVR